MGLGTEEAVRIGAACDAVVVGCGFGLGEANAVVLVGVLPPLMSRSRFAAGFTESVGLYLASRRIRPAARELRTTDRAVPGIRCDEHPCPH
ncbi:hypothetical protein [Streptomyces barringtoniae]|uniref:hypothetical protein n=1 Tax=Streptomyces barringtoniae TaxID=2892029 RepID=UPI001E2D461F|nr:hypothetical protein [Streptomyces barringtoniae]MCC5474188.1 hypothetical protein [Streptomyces barringtoniae]